ncbi:MAG TPA: hypothetical protein VG826_29865 [Pirellulales bacterium]|nr:hypothetical protein [Pirellulales bacterium]
MRGQPISSTTFRASKLPLSFGWILWLCLAPAVVGCRGCSTDDPLTAEEREAKTQELKQKEKQKPDFEFIKYAVQPGGTEGDEPRSEVYLKPGHWTSATLRSRANNFDFRGELLGEAHDQAARPVPLDEIPFHLRTTRPVILPKGQQRLLEFSIFMPVETRSKSISTRLLTGPGGRPVFTESQVLKAMPPHQYYFVVLALNPNAYSFIKRLDSITAPTSSEKFFDPLVAHHYRVALPQIKTIAPLPSQPLGWTSIAYVLWDDLEPKKLSPEQQTAMLDWLHWGGQLIVSGPESLATLKGSFLDEFLPAAAGDTWQLKVDALEPLNKRWHVGDRPLKAVRPWSGVHLKLAAGAETVVSSGDEPLVAERRTGRGRVVLTAFRLSQRELRDWPSFDNFLNNVLLRRPPREFRYANETLNVTWLDQNPAHDERRVSQVRYFTRDAKVPPKEFEGLMRTRAVTAAPPADELNQAAQFNQFNRFGMPAWQPGDGEPDYGSGAAGWNDFSPASNVALDTLRKAAGISVPDARFVVLVLGTYIAVLVPVNWLVFRLLGRVEWAWVAAPFISIGGAIAVVYLAQLDIGFARSKSELAVMELQSSYGRAHLTRYLALYSSLGTRYQLRFDDQSALALPFAAGQRILVGQGIGAVDYRRTPQLGDENEEVAQVTLDGLEISSNTTGMVHSEEMLDAGGGFGWQSLGGNRYRLANDTRFAWEGVVVIGPRQSAWVGTLGAGAAATVELTDRLPQAVDLWSQQLGNSPVTSDRPSDGLNLRNFYRLAECQLNDETSANELRVIGWTADEVAGLTIRPGASQSRQLTFVVGHLDYGPAVPVTSDQGSRRLAYQAAGKLPPPETEEEEEESDAAESGKD